MRRKHYLVHRIQLWFGALLFIYSLVFFGLAHVAQFAPVALKLDSSLPLQERARAASRFLVMDETTFAALIAITLGAGAFAIYFTHRLAGPLHRFEQCARELVQGNLAMRLQFRKSDKLHELRDLLNHAVATLDYTMIQIRTHQANLHRTLGDALDEAQGGLLPTPGLISSLEAARKESQCLEELLNRFRLSIPQ